jgi:hypothetical protein
MALGPNNARSLEAYLRLEMLASRLRGAIGNSTTARRLHELAMVGIRGCGGLLGGAVLGESLGGEHGGVEGALLGLVAGFAQHRVRHVNMTFARRVGEMLASEDPAVPWPRFRQPE